MQALILCGGLGTRLRNTVGDAPKSMAPIRGKPFLEILLESLKARGFREFVLATGYKSEAVEGYFGNGGKWGVAIAYSRENSPLGTGGALKLAEPHLGDQFFLLNGDTFGDFDPAAMEKRMRAGNAAVVMALKAVQDVSRYGRVEMDTGGRILKFSEKGKAAGPGLVNAGIYLIRKHMLSQIELFRALSLENDVLPRVFDRGVYGCEIRGLFIDIGVPEDYQRAQSLLPGSAHAG